MDDLYYSDYIELDTILNSQHPRSFEKMEDGNDETSHHNSSGIGAVVQADHLRTNWWHILSGASMTLTI
jgi:hypothetical protein